MAQSTPLNGVFGRDSNGNPRIEHHSWPPHDIDGIEWRNLTNEDIIALVTQKVMVAVVLQDTTQSHLATLGELNVIKQLFDEFNQLHKDEKPHFKIYFGFSLILYNGEHCISNRVRTIEAQLQQIAPHSATYSRVAHEMLAGHERIVTAKAWGISGDHPVVMGAHKVLPGSVVDVSTGFPGPSFK
ncbi:uncharacterized protein TRUGW13939_07694 [Talaromyces rugulosus]|uniref:Uncharacterized protein n=1 Tax=Talaromyces rugulosus TaxID=121627 RepID=A0A7H8R2E6_TALRU|nr:uncharacterized protein TRUGW13939_07694 [Talaromyces rugulosus]QKX60549.1 hypothetical protein TRUGW13939_07694 [Talaromyces rugulosus]